MKEEKINKEIKTKKYKRNDEREDDRRNTTNFKKGMMKEKIREGIKAKKYKRNDGREDERRNKSKEIQKELWKRR